ARGIAGERVDRGSRSGAGAETGEWSPGDEHPGRRSQQIRRREADRGAAEAQLAAMHMWLRSDCRPLSRRRSVLRSEPAVGPPNRATDRESELKSPPGTADNSYAAPR